MYVGKTSKKKEPGMHGVMQGLNPSYRQTAKIRLVVSRLTGFRKQGRNGVGMQASMYFGNLGIIVRA